MCGTTREYDQVMQKTTLYLPESLKRHVEEIAKVRGCSETDVIRRAIELYVERPRPTLPLARGSGETTLAEGVDELLAEGFGRD
jgi:metal-responsive CopG/Arc/MetJ family transcriptional regulator